MDWQAALDLHINYAASTRVPGRLVSELQAFTRSYVGTNMDRVDVAAYAGAIDSQITTTVDRAQTYFISDQVMPTLLSAAEGMELFPQPLWPYHFPSKYGFVVFEKPLEYKDYDSKQGETGTMLPIAAVAWQHMDFGPDDDGKRVALTDREGNPTKGMMFYLYVSADWVEHRIKTDEEANGGRSQYVRSSEGPLALIDMLPWAFGVPWGVASEPTTEHDWKMIQEKVDQFYDGHHSLTVDEVLGGAQITMGEPSPSRIQPHVAMFRRFILTLGLFMDQRILPPEHMFPGRSSRKRWTRTFKPHPEREASVLVLRRIDRDVMGYDRHARDGEVGVVQRHVVRDHWRRFYMRSTGLPVGHPGAYRWRYVAPYERGEGVVELRHKVTAVVR